MHDGSLPRLQHDERVASDTTTETSPWLTLVTLPPCFWRHTVAVWQDFLSTSQSHWTFCKAWNVLFLQSVPTVYMDIPKIRKPCFDVWNYSACLLQTTVTDVFCQKQWCLVDASAFFFFYGTLQTAVKMSWISTFAEWLCELQSQKLQGRICTNSAAVMWSSSKRALYSKKTKHCGDKQPFPADCAFDLV